MKSKRILLSFLVLTLTIFQGCSFVGLSDDELLQPPKATGVKADILGLLEQTTNGDYKLKYPQNGDNISAIMMSNIGGGDSDEAIAFYTTSKDNNLSMNIMFMEDINGKWQNLGSFNNGFTEVDRVYFSDVDKDGKDEVIIGWKSNLTNSNQINLYDYDNGSVIEVLVVGDPTYVDMVLMDITADSVDDLIVFTSTTDETTSKVNSYAQLYSNCIDGKFSKVSETEITADVVNYSQVLSGNIAKNVKGIFLDGYMSNKTDMLTDVIYYSPDEKALLCPLTHKQQAEYYEDEKNIPPRTTSSICKDIDDDGIIEVPSPYVPNVSNKGFSSMPITRWYKLDVENDGALVETNQTVASYSDGYYFILPKEWCDNVAVQNDNTARSTSIYHINSMVFEGETVENSTEKTTESATIPSIDKKDDEQPTTPMEQAVIDEEPLITITVFSDKVWENEKVTKEAEGYIVIKNSSGLVYAYKVGKHDKDTAYTLTAEQVSDNFRLLN